MFHRLKIFTASLGLALAYFATGRLGLMLPAFGTSITLIWLPTGIAVAALLRWGFGCWPGITLGAMAVNLSLGTALPTVLGIAVGNTCGPLLAAWILRRSGFHPAFDRKRDILLLAGAAMVGMLVSSSIGTFALQLARLMPGDGVTGWLIWWAGDTMGVLAAAPLVLACTRREMRAIFFRRWEFVLWLGALILATCVVFIVDHASDDHVRGLSCVPLPLLAWAALRFGPIGTSLAIIVISAGAASAASLRQGPFFQLHPIEGLAVLWIYMATSVALGWLITALHAAHVQATGIQRIFERALSDVSLGLLSAGVDGRITFANEGFTRLTGYTAAEIIGGPCSILQGPETDRGTVDAMRAALRGDGYFDGEILNYRKDGTTFWNALLISPVRDESGQKTGFLGIQRDVSERKAAEDARHQSEEQLRLAMSAAEQGLYDLNVQTGECVVSVEYALMLGYEPAAFRESNEAWRDRLHPDDRETAYKTYTEYVTGQRNDYRVEFRQRTKAGGWKWILSLGSLVARSADGRPLRMLGTHTDITERKMAEEALRESEERLRILSDATFEGIAISAGGVFLDCNDQLAQILSRPRADVVGMRISEFIAPEHRSLVAEAQRTGRLDPFEHLIVRGDGTLRTVAVRARMAQVGGRQLRITAVQDITERKKGEQALRESESRYRELFEANPHPMWVYDLESLRFLAVNNAAIAHYGYSREEFLAMTLKDIRPPQDIPALLASVARATEGFDESSGWRHCKRDGTLIDVEVSSHLIDFAGRRAEVVLAHDVTERRRSEARLLHAEDAERRRIAKEMHDSTAQDLVAVIMNLGALQESLAPGDAKAARILEDSIALVENSVNDIRTLSYVLHPPRLDETGLAGGLAEYAAGFTTRTDTRIHVEAERDFGRLAEDVEIVLFRVAQEGIANVLRHSRSDTATIRLARKDGNVVLEIEDYGRGMADAGARGVGITGMRERLQQLGGRLEIESDSGGTIVRAVLPHLN